MCWCYIIFSKSKGRYYIGITSNLEKRLSQHISGMSSFTRQANDWKIVWSLTCVSRDRARETEKFIKRMKSRKYIQKLISGEYSIPERL